MLYDTDWHCWSIVFGERQKYLPGDGPNNTRLLNDHVAPKQGDVASFINDLKGLCYLEYMGIKQRRINMDVKRGRRNA